MAGPHLTFDIDIDTVATGGDGIGRDESGRVVFVPGTAPGDRVQISMVEEKARFARGAVVEVLSAGPARVEPPCPHVAEGCGGCGWQHIDAGAQRELKAQIVADALRRIGHIDDVPDIDPGPELAALGHRTTVRGAVVDGRFAFRAAGSHEVVGADGCLTAHPLVRQLIDDGRFGAAREATIRVATATGDRLVLLDPRVAGSVDVPGDVVVVGAEEVRAGREAYVHEVVAGRTWRISARSFFQTRTDGAEALVAVARHHLQDALTPAARLVDLYAGVGLFAGALGAGGAAASVVAVEGNAGSARDARFNLADLGEAVEVVKADVAKWRPSPADVVVADPSRDGLGQNVVDRIAATGASTLVLISCDAGSLGRDAGLLAAAGFHLDAVTLVDLFPQTPHIEAVTLFTHPTRP